MRPDQIAIQLYTVREAAAQDFDETLRKVAEAGYTAVEFAGFQGLTTETVKGLLDKHGLRAAAAHVPLTDFQQRIDGVIDDLTTVEAEWAIVPWIAPGDRTEEALTEIAGQFEEFARKVQSAGLRFAYHNHDFEFSQATANGQTLFDAMVERTTPGLVHFELDLLWVKAGGYDPAEVITKHGDRIALVHLKDATEDGLARREDLPFGEGMLDWPAILAAARAAGVEWYVTEQDRPNPDDPFADAATALRNAQRMAQ